jgi:hypothetical protein
MMIYLDRDLRFNGRKACAFSANTGFRPFEPKLSFYKSPKSDQIPKQRLIF